ATAAAAAFPPTVAVMSGDLQQWVPPDVLVVGAVVASSIGIPYVVLHLSPGARESMRRFWKDGVAPAFSSAAVATALLEVAKQHDVIAFLTPAAHATSEVAQHLAILVGAVAGWATAKLTQ